MAPKQSLKVIGVTGGRRFSDPDALSADLDNAAAGYVPEDIVLRHGRCNPRNEVGDPVDWDKVLAMPPQDQWDLDGADWHAHLWALKHGWTIQERPANWGRHGKKAGGVRNQEMVDEEPRMDVLIAAPDPNSRGTWDCVRRAKRAGIPTTRIEV